MQTFLGILFYVPGAMEAFVFVACWISRVRRERRCAWAQLGRAQLHAALLLFLISVAACLAQPANPLYSLTMLGLAAVAVPSCRRPSKRLGLLTLGLSAMLWALAFRQFSEVEKEMTLPATWEIGERGRPASGNPPERLVEFRLGHGESTAVFSDELAGYLRAKGEPSVALTLTLFYHWGRSSGHVFHRVNGKEFAWRGGYGSVSCRGSCSKFYLGNRGF